MAQIFLLITPLGHGSLCPGGLRVADSSVCVWKKLQFESVQLFGFCFRPDLEIREVLVFCEVYSPSFRLNRKMQLEKRKVESLRFAVFSV